MADRKRRRSDRAGRPPMRSPGRPMVARREDRQRFWARRVIPAETAHFDCAYPARSVNKCGTRDKGLASPEILLDRMKHGR